LRIAYINNHSEIPSRGAESIFMMKMASAYSKSGHEVYLFASPGSKEYQANSSIFEYYGVPETFKLCLHRIRNGRISVFLFMTIILPFKIWLKRPSIAHSRNLVAALILARIFRVKVLYEMHDRPDKNRRMFQLFQALCRSKQLSGLVTITHSLGNYIKNLAKSEVPLLIAPDGIDEVRNENFDRIQLQKELGLYSFEKKAAVYTGHLYEGRGIELIIEIAQRLNGYHFYIIGGTDEDINRCKKLSFHSKNISYLGFCDPSKVHLYQKAADVLLMPYADKVKVSGGGDTAKFASPLKMFEYMASGRPIVSSTLPVLYEVLQHDVNAFMVPYSDSEGWIRTLDMLLEFPDKGEQVAKRAFTDVQEFTWIKRAKRIEQFILN
jgi:glycosyltransferase involved in cell wall biosynthesis